MKNKKGKITILVAVIIVIVILAAAFWLNIFRESGPDYFLNVNLSPERIAELESRLEQNFKRLEEFPNTYEVYIDLGNIARELGNASMAIKYFKKAWQIIPSNSTPWLNIGRIYISLKLYGEAEAAFLKAKDINPNYDRVYLSLAELYEKYLTQKSVSVRGIYLEGLAAIDEDDQLLVSFATYLTESGSYTEALLYWEELVDRHPKNKSYLEMIDYINELRANN